MSTAALDIDGALARAMTARDAGCRWIIERIGPDGEPVGDTPLLEARIPLMLSLCGHPALAARSLRWHAENGGPELLEGNGERYAPYFLALVAHGAAHLGRSDTAAWLCDELQDWHAPCGAPWSRLRAGCGEVEIVPGCQVGMTYLAAGRIDDAVRIADLVVDLWEQQPEPEERLYLILDPEGKVILHPPVGLDEGEREYYVLERTGQAQHFFTGGIAAALLVQTAWATGEQRYVDAAKPYLRFAYGQPHQLEVYQGCKTAWGAAYMTAATGDRESTEWTVRMGDWFVGEQRPDGSWVDPNYLDDPSAVALLTSEFTQHLWSVAFGLGHARVIE